MQRTGVISEAWLKIEFRSVDSPRHHREPHRLSQRPNEQDNSGSLTVQQSFEPAVPRYLLLPLAPALFFNFLAKEFLRRFKSGFQIGGVPDRTFREQLLPGLKFACERPTPTPGW